MATPRGRERYDVARMRPDESSTIILNSRLRSPGPMPSRRERLVFALAVGIIALHVFIDAFVAMEPGVARSDHIITSALPIAVCAFAIWLYPRLRAGARATMAIVLGILALFGAEVSVGHALAAGPTGDDWTGLLLSPAGLVLGGLGVLLLWRSRKSNGRRLRRRVFIAVLSVVVAFELVLPVGVAIIATHRARVPVDVVDFDRPSEEITLTDKDGLKLAATYVPSANGAVVVTFPREWTARQAQMLARRGFGVLMLDPRGYGASEGDPNAFGWGSTQDLDAAVAYLQTRADVKDGRIGGLGLSVGGEQMIEAAATNDGLRAVVSEGAGERSVRETLLYGWRGLPSLPNAAVQTAAVAALSGHAPPPSLPALVSEIAPRPILLIYAGRGGGGEELQPEFFAAAAQPKTLWSIPEASHTAGIAVRPEEYEQRVIGFFEDALLR